MKNTTKIIGAVIAMALTGATAHAAVEPVEMRAPQKTLVDFKAEYAGTKPVVAINKYWEYQALQRTPRPTLAVTTIREEDERGQALATGTKPVVGALRKFEGRN